MLITDSPAIAATVSRTSTPSAASTRKPTKARRPPRATAPRRQRGQNPPSQIPVAERLAWHPYLSPHRAATAPKWPKTIRPETQPRQRHRKSAMSTPATVILLNNNASLAVESPRSQGLRPSQGFRPQGPPRVSSGPVADSSGGRRDSHLPKKKKLRNWS